MTATPFTDMRRRHRRASTANPVRHYCPADNQDWPCEVARALELLDRAAVATEQRQADAAAELEGWRLHARLDHAALGRVWALTRRWDERAAGMTGIDKTILAAYAEAVRAAIGGDPCVLPRPHCAYCGAELAAQGPRPDWAAVGVPGYPVLYCPGHGTGEDGLPLHVPAPAGAAVVEAASLGPMDIDEIADYAHVLSAELGRALSAIRARWPGKAHM